MANYIALLSTYFAEDLFHQGIYTFMIKQTLDGSV